MHKIPDYINRKGRNEMKKKIIEVTGCDKTQKIPAIKAVRCITGLGLRESKGIIDAVLTSGEPQAIAILHEEYTKEQITRIMADGSVSYTYLYNTIHDKLKDALTAALDIDRMDVAYHLFEAIKTNNGKE